MVEESRNVATPGDAARPVLTAAAVRKTASRERLPPRDQTRIAGEDRRQMIAEAAYFRAVERGFGPGRELEDWLAAEIEVNALLNMDDERA